MDWGEGEPVVLYVFPDPVQFPNERCYTLTCKQGVPGWETDSGQASYGLPRDIAIEMASRYNAGES